MVQSNYCWLVLLPIVTQIFLLYSSFSIEIEETEIILNDTSVTNRSNTFYTVDLLDNNNENSTSTTTKPKNNGTNVLHIENDSLNELHVDDFWDASTPPSLPSSPSSSSMSSSTSAIIADADGEFNFTETASSMMSSFMTFTTTAKPTFTIPANLFSSKPKLDSRDNGNSIDNEEKPEELHKIWNVVLHGTNMNSEELKYCNSSLVENHAKKYSRRKVALNLKNDLDQKFSRWNYRFSVIVSATSRNTMGKALHGVWLSMTINEYHYFVTATRQLIDGPKLKEGELSVVEYWALVHSLSAQNMTGHRKYNRIASKLKKDLDRFYGNGNSWSVVIVKNRYLVKAKVFENPNYHIEFPRFNGGHYILFRGGENIEDTDNREDRDQIVLEDEHLSETENEYDTYLEKVYMLT